MARVVRARISVDALSAADCISAVADPAAGGVGVFIGAVRDVDHGRPVDALDYEAHPSAAEELARVCAAVGDQHEVIALAAEHRVGELHVGDVAVVVAVAAVHRDEAITAAHALIDQIKAGVPIWKHQRFTDGSDEWIGCC